MSKVDRELYRAKYGKDPVAYFKNQPDVESVTVVHDEIIVKYKPNAKVVFMNDNMYENGMYYATSVELHKDDSDELPKEDQVEIGSNYATQAYGWECLND